LVARKSAIDERKGDLPFRLDYIRGHRALERYPGKVDLGVATKNIS
jgi:hypothetical protein